MEPKPETNLLALSDVHLGAGLKSTRPSAVNDEPLIAWLDHHRLHRRAGQPWRLVMVGDILDFVSVLAVPEGPALPFAVSRDERQFGLEPEEEKSAWKLARIVEHHRGAFSALARFVAAGHEVVFVQGNHDLELAWPAVQRLIRARLTVGAADGSAGERVQFRDRVHLEPGRAYFEHGHAYDCFCLPEPHLAGEAALPLPVSSLVLRYFGNRHAAQDVIERAEGWGALEFVRWFLKTQAPWQVASDYVAMVIRILRASSGGARRPRRDPLEPLRQELLGTAPHHRDAPRGLAELAVEPALVSLERVVQLFYLDRLALTLAAPALALLSWRFLSGPAAALSTALVVLSTAVLFPVLARFRRTESHPLLERAAHPLADLFGVPLVVMGHTHRAVDLPVGRRGSRYINLGSWTHPGALGFPYLVLTGDEIGLRHWRWETVPARLPQLEPALATETA